MKCSLSIEACGVAYAFYKSMPWFGGLGFTLMFLGFLAHRFGPADSPPTPGGVSK